MSDNAKNIRPQDWSEILKDATPEAIVYRTRFSGQVDGLNIRPFC